MAKASYEPFPEGDDFNELADRLRRDVAGVVLILQSSAVYQALTPVEQIEVVMAGLTTATVGCCFAMVENKGQREVMRAIRSYLKQAADHSNEILSDRPTPTQGGEG
jgi:hypothetical protein